MNRVILSVIFSVFLFFAGCGKVSVQDELELVPGLCFVHVHVEHSMDIHLIPESINEFFPLWLCDSLHVRGNFGVSLLGVNLTDFSPQLLFLSREVGIDEMLRFGTDGFLCDFEEKSGTYNLIDNRGGMIGSIAGRDGWTCLITGNGSDRAAQRWLDLQLDESLASDSNLISISESDADLTFLISHNSIAFVSVIPTGMLSREQIGMLNSAKDMIQSYNPQALRISFDISNAKPPVIDLEFQLVRNGNNISTFSVNFSDTGITPADIIQHTWHR